MTKRLTALLLAFAVLFCCALTSRAEDFDDDEDFEFEEFDDDEEFEDDETDFRTIAGYDTGEKHVFGDFVYQLEEDGEGAVITNYSGTAGDVVIPDQVDGHPVVAVGPHMFAYNEAVESVQLPEGIRSIGNMAFFKCVNLQGIVIPEGVTTIDECCFGGCEGLAEVQLPSSLEEIGRFSFLACTSLTEVSFGESLKSIGPGAFQMCASLTRVTIPGGDSVSIEADSFEGCSPDFEIVN